MSFDLGDGPDFDLALHFSFNDLLLGVKSLQRADLESIILGGVHHETFLTVPGVLHPVLAVLLAQAFLVFPAGIPKERVEVVVDLVALVLPPQAFLH